MLKRTSHKIEPFFDAVEMQNWLSFQSLENKIGRSENEKEMKATKTIKNKTAGT